MHDASSERSADDASRSGMQRAGASGQSSSTGSEAQGRFYSRARNRASQWEGRGSGEGYETWGTEGARGGQRGYTSGYGLRNPREMPQQTGGDRPAGFREPTGFGYGTGGYANPGYGAAGYADRAYRGRDVQGRELGDRAAGGREYGQRGLGDRGYGDRDFSDVPADRPPYYGGAAGGMVSERGFGVTERGEERRSRWRREPLRASEIMTRNPKAVRPDSSIRDVAQVMKDENTGIVPVVDGEGKLLGVVTDRDIVMRSIPEGKDPAVLRAQDLMTDDVEAVTPDDSVRDVVRTMGDRQVRRVPVVDHEDVLVGIISMADVATRADFDTDLQEALEEISSKRSFWSRIFG
ncbi:MAG TPA: CBS domain-containing protein [Gemmatimonadaceae bacterium]|nr:CBS domain-containing protein [Gemmatimonadaceae bacterium]